MRHCLRTLIAVLIAVAVAATLALLGGTSPSYGDGQGPCPLCREEFVSNDLISGGNECAHGPEYDSDCGNPPDCCEVKPEGCKGTPGECECFKCGQSKGCEELFERWIAWCGLSGLSPDTCNNNGGTGASGVVLRYKTRWLKEGPACPYSGGYKSKKECSGVIHDYGCVAPSGSCVESGNWIEKTGNREKCKSL